MLAAGRGRSERALHAELGSPRGAEAVSGDQTQEREGPAAESTSQTRETLGLVPRGLHLSTRYAVRTDVQGSMTPGAATKAELDQLLCFSSTVIRFFQDLKGKILLFGRVGIIS